MSKLNILGVTDGIGSMLVGAREKYNVLGNIEWRRYYHTGTFEKNFPGSFMVKSITDVPKNLPKVHVIMSHPECGNFSLLNMNRAKVAGNCADIPLLIEAIQELKPDYFAMDNLPRSVEAYTQQMWANALPEYDLFPEFVSNYHYGNVQKYRKRFFMIGAKKEKKYVFIPGEFNHNITVADIFEDISEDDPNQVQADPNDRGTIGMTIGEAAEVWKSLPHGKYPEYTAKDGTTKARIGQYKTYWDKHSHVLTGAPTTFHPLTGFPLTCRERAKIQGFPDDFIFIFKNKKEATGSLMAKQTGKAMPVQFCTYLTDQFHEHATTGTVNQKAPARSLKLPDYIAKQKQEYCESIGYSNQSIACVMCSNDNCSSRKQEPEFNYL